ncbi:MAG TPA: serine hydrolase, partial [Candidatus Dormibacteraeota bacterium]
FSLVRNQRLAVSTTLQPRLGVLAVTAPGGNAAELLIDGNAVGAGGWTGELPVGHHTVVFRTADTWPWVAGVDVQWQQKTTVQVAPTPVVPGDEGAFVAGLNAYLGSLGGQYGVWLDDLSSGHQLGYHQGDVMEAASVIKVPLALYVLDQVAQNKIKLSDTVQLQDSDFMGGTGTLYYSNAPGDTFSYQDLLALLIQQSDNTAWKALGRVVGTDKVDAYAASIGAPDCHQEDDNCTAQEAGVMLAKLAGGSVLDANGRQMLLGWLENTAFNDRINYYLSNGAVAHKVGMDGGVMNDSGIVLGSHQFVISMFTTSENPDQGVQAIRDVARAAAKYYSR